MKRGRPFLKNEAHTNTPPPSPTDKLMVGLANSKRREVVRILLKGEVSVGTLADMVSLSQSSLSQHLKKLRDAQIVKSRRAAQTIYYFCDNPAAARIMSVLDAIGSDGSLNLQERLDLLMREAIRPFMGRPITLSLRDDIWQAISSVGQGAAAAEADHG